MPTTPIITWSNPADITYGSVLTRLQLNAYANVEGIFVYTPAAGALLSAGAGQTLSCTFYPTDTADYTIVTTTVTINVDKASPAITWSAPSNINVGIALSSIQLNASVTGSIPGTFEYTPALGTVLGLGSFVLNTVFVPTDTDNYNTSISSVIISVVDVLESLTMLPNFVTFQLGSVQQLIVIGNYLSGAIQNYTTTATYLSSSANVTVTSGGLLTAVSLGSSIITITVNSVSYTLNLTVLPIIISSVPPNTNFYRSHITQELLNYFDSKDMRIRNHPMTLDAQLLTIPAVGIDDLSLRLTREQQRNMEAPCNIDNGGVYYGFTNNSIDLTSISTVTGIVNSNQITFTPYDDTIPIPAAIVLAETVPLTNPIIATFAGGPLVITNTIGTLPIVGKLNFFLDVVTSQVVDINIAITGSIYPQSVWQKYHTKTTELLNISIPGQITSLYQWQSISSITVRGLMTGSTITGYVLPFNAPRKYEPYKYYVGPEDRGTKLDRYWSVDTTNKMICESKIVNAISGFDIIQTYKFTQNITDIAVEPFTYGLYAVNNNTLFYSDRREPMPDKMSATVLTKDPIYSLLVYYDASNPGIFNSVKVVPVLVPNSLNAFQYRLAMLDPFGNKTVVLPNGATADYTPNNGWRTNTPTPVTVTLGFTGTYVFYIEAQDIYGNQSVDAFQYGNFPFTPLATIDLSGISTTITGVSFDDDGNLWINDTNNAYKLDIVYNGYIVDPNTNILYLTENATGVEVS
jgi:hypothetical protein